MASKKKIMIVDDDPDVRLTLKQLFEKSGYQVIQVEDGIDCIQALKKGEKPNLIILDVTMPVYSGWEVQRRLSADMNWKNIPIVFLTGRSTDTAIEMCKKFGVDYIKKPFDINDLKDRIESVLHPRKNKKSKVCM